MRAADILKRLNQAQELISVFPDDTEILSVNIDGTGWTQDLSNVHLARGEWDRLIAANVLGPEKPVLPYNEDYNKHSLLTGGFELLELIEKKKAAPGVTSTESGTAE